MGAGRPAPPNWTENTHPHPIKQVHSRSHGMPVPLLPRSTSPNQPHKRPHQSSHDSSLNLSKTDFAACCTPIRLCTLRLIIRHRRQVHAAARLGQQPCICGHRDAKQVHQMPLRRRNEETYSVVHAGATPVNPPICWTAWLPPMVWPWSFTRLNVCMPMW